MSSMLHNSIWLKNAGVEVSTLPSTYPPLQNSNDMHFDVAVVGGGIVGCTLAYLLKSAGRSVALIEARHIGSGVTSYSTAKLSAQQGPVYSTITAKHNKAAARAYYDMNMAGIQIVEDLTRELNLDCAFDRRSHTTWTAQISNEAAIYAEYEACAAIGIPCSMVDQQGLLAELPPSVGARMGISFPHQAHFNPYKFCTELAKHVNGQDCAVFEHSRVFEVDHGAPHRLTLPENGSSLTADHVMLATHLPIMDRSMHFSMLEPSRSHCIAFKVRNPRMQNMFISVEEPLRSLRVTGENNDIIVLAGDSIKQGQTGETHLLYEDLEQWARAHFEVEEVVARWSAMDYFSADHIPFMGLLYRATDSLYTATGFSKWGLANGVAGARLVADLILGKKDVPFQDLVDARRWDLSTQWRGILNENLHTATHLVGDKIKHFGDWMSRRVDSLPPGEGGICSAGAKKVGAFRDHDGLLHVVHPICTHLGCDLTFNKGDRTWDCPCHGSQFDVDGKVLHGPACKALDRIFEW